MDDPALDKTPAAEAHVPWESLDASDEEFESEAEIGAQEERPMPAQSSVAPPPSAVPDRTSMSSERVPPASDSEADPGPSRGGGWTLPLLCGGIALIACCAVIPQADANRRLAYERQVLQRDLQSIEKQVAVNGEFLKKVGRDPTLAERLAGRQMRVIPEGSRVLELPHEAGGSSMSPFQLVNVPAPPPLPPYKPIGGVIARLCYDTHSRLYVIGVALGMIATGLVLGSAPLTQNRQ